MNTLEQLRCGALAGARRLDLACGLTELPREVFDLAESLEVLNVTGNRLRDLPEDLGRLKRLKILFASSNAFTRVPEQIGECPALEMVGFKSNRITELPAAALPERLRWLILTDNALERVPEALGERPALQKLMLAGNRLRTLPESLVQARRLELLRLSANRLDVLPAWLARLPRLSWLALAGNPGLQPVSPRQGLRPLAWSEVRLDGLLGEGASGTVHRVRTLGGEAPAATDWALKLFKGRVTSDGLPEHEMAAGEAAGTHPSLCTPVARLHGHPEGLAGMLLPLLPQGCTALAAPPSLESCTRDVYPPGFMLPATAAHRLILSMAQALAHLHERGVMHGDFYAHNLMWHASTATAVLSDLGGATLLDPRDAQTAAWLTTDVRAFGVLLGEVLWHSDLEAAPEQGSAAGPWHRLAQACLDPDPAQRPTMADVCAQCQGA